MDESNDHEKIFPGIRRNLVAIYSATVYKIDNLRLYIYLTSNHLQQHVVYHVLRSLNTNVEIPEEYLSWNIHGFYGRRKRSCI